jgi:hypothetical protein
VKDKEMYQVILKETKQKVLGVGLISSLVLTACGGTQSAPHSRDCCRISGGRASATVIFKHWRELHAERSKRRIRHGDFYTGWN